MTKLHTLLLLLPIFAFSCAANTITFLTPAGATLNGLPVDAMATFTSSNGTLLISLFNLEPNPTSVVQNLSNLEFELDNGSTNASLTSSSGTNVTINGDGTFVLGSSVSTGWALNALSGNTLQLTVLGTPTAPTHTIVGPPGSGGYSNINGSFGGPHNPFLWEHATFTLSSPDITSTTTISSALFSFNTAPGYDVPGTPQVPEPGTLVLIGSGLPLAVLFLRRRKR